MAERRYTVVFLVAIVLALGATYGVFRALQSIRQASHVAVENVVVADHDIPEGAVIQAGEITTSEWPAASAPAGAFSVRDSVVGRVTRVAVFAGEPIVPGRLAPVGTGPGIEVKITPGKRAMAVRIDDLAGISGLVQPNSRVDVLITMHGMAKLFMENMRVLSVGTQVFRDEEGKPIRASTATLEVNSEEAERLAIAAGSGVVQLVLRGYGDPDSVKTRGATAGDVLAQLRENPPVPVFHPDPDPPVRHHATPTPRHVELSPAPVVTFSPAPTPKRPDSVTVQVFRAGKVSQQHFQRDSASSADSAAH
jgi:pilus assembly protein CpaB